MCTLLDVSTDTGMCHHVSYGSAMHGIMGAMQRLEGSTSLALRNFITTGLKVSPSGPVVT